MKIDSLKEQIQALSVEQKISLWNEWKRESNPDDEIHVFDEDFFDTYFADRPFEAVRSWNFGENSFADDYIGFDGYGNLTTYSDYKAEQMVDSEIDELVEYIMENESDFDLDYYDIEIEEDLPNEVTEETYYDMLEVLPPFYFDELNGEKMNGFAVGEPSDHKETPDGFKAVYSAYYKRDGKYFSVPSYVYFLNDDVEPLDSWDGQKAKTVDPVDEFKGGGSAKSIAVKRAEAELRKAKRSKITSWIDEASRKLDMAYENELTGELEGERKVGIDTGIAIDLPFDSDKIFTKVYDKYNSRDYWDIKGQQETQIGNWKRASAKGDENAKKYTEKEIREIVAENNKVRTYYGTYLPLVEAINKMDKDFLISRVRYDQKVTREFFEEITGIKLPKSNKDLKSYFSSATSFKTGGSAKVDDYTWLNAEDHVGRGRSYDDLDIDERAEYIKHLVELHKSNDMKYYYLSQEGKDRQAIDLLDEDEELKKEIKNLISDYNKDFGTNMSIKSFYSSTYANGGSAKLYHVVDQKKLLIGASNPVAKSFTSRREATLDAKERNKIYDPDTKMFVVLTDQQLQQES